MKLIFAVFSALMIAIPPAHAGCDSNISKLWEANNALLGAMPGIGDTIKIFVALSKVGNIYGCDSPGSVTAEMVADIVNKQLDASFDTMLDNDLWNLSENTAIENGNYERYYDFGLDGKNALLNTKNLVSFEAVQAQIAVATIAMGFFELAEYQAVDEFVDLDTRNGKLYDVRTSMIQLANNTLEVLSAQNQSFESYIEDNDNYHIEYDFDFDSGDSPYSDDVRARLVYSDGTFDSWSSWEDCNTPLFHPRCRSGSGFDRVTEDANKKKANFKNAARERLFGNDYNTFIARLAKQITSTTNFCENRHAIIRVSNADLTMHSWGGNGEGNQITLHGGMSYAKNHDNSKFKIISHNSNRIFQTRNTDLTMHAWGGATPRANIRLHYGLNYAKEVPNSQFKIVEEGDFYIFKVSNADLTMHAYGGSKDGVAIKLHGGMDYARAHANSKYSILCTVN